MPCCFQSPWQWGHFIQYSPPHSPMDEIFRGGIWKLFPKGWLCRHPLIFRNFLRGTRKKSLYICFVLLKGGCCVVTFDLFFLGWVKVNSPYPRGGGGGGVAIKWNGPWFWGFRPPFLRLLVIFFTYFFIRATDPKSGNAFDAKRKKGGWP